MTHSQTFTLEVPPDRVVRLPAWVPVGRVELAVMSPPRPDDAASRRANRARLAGACAGEIVASDEAFAPMTPEELAVWYRPLES